MLKKALVAIVLSLTFGLAIGQYANCWQQYVCGPAGCQWITICR